MSGTVDDFLNLLSGHASDVVFHRVLEAGEIPCPCRTPEGYRDPEWHAAHPLEPMCNERGLLPGPGGEINLLIKAFVQPIQSTRATRLSTEYIEAAFGTVEADDHLGIFPESWGGVSLDFYSWSESGDEYITYNGRKFRVVNANLIPDPANGNPRHHWEAGLRLLSSEPLV